MSRVVITGGTGMVGAALARACLASGHEVTVLVPEYLPRLAPLPKDARLSFVDCDVRNLTGYGSAEIGRADMFFHLAWLGTAPGARGLLHSQFDNVGYALDAVELASRLGCQVFVGAGSQAEYGRVEGVLTPATPTLPETGYGVAKLAAGQMTRLACAELGIRHEWARILSVYGPGDNPHTMVMSVISEALAGVDPRCTMGEQLWDYLYCDDCGRALLAMGECGVDGRVYPVGSGVQRRLSEFIRCICDACGTCVNPAFGSVPYQDKQVMYLCADVSSLVSDTGWHAEVPFEEGIARTIEWTRIRDRG